MNNEIDKEFLKKQKEQLLIKKTHIDNELKSLTHKKGSETDINFPKYGETDEDMGVEVEDYEEMTTVAGDLKEELVKVNKALKKIEEGKYGISEKTKKPISKERLEAYPEAEDEI